MNQINHAFGETLEFSCTINDGKITAQELVTSGPDVIVTVRMDQGHYLGPDDLEGLAGEMRAYLSDGKYSRADEGEADIYMAAAKDFLLSHPVLKSADPGVAYALAEYIAYRDYKTLYDAAVTKKPEPILSVVQEERYTHTPFAESDEEDDFDDDEDDEDDDFDEDDYDCDSCFDGEALPCCNSFCSYFDDEDDDEEDEDLEDESDDDDDTDEPDTIPNNTWRGY